MKGGRTLVRQNQINCVHSWQWVDYRRSPSVSWFLCGDLRRQFDRSRRPQCKTRFLAYLSAVLANVGSVECRINGVNLHYVERGSGVPVLALHGAGVDHREIEAAFEAVVHDTGYRRIYPDLPGMGRSTAAGLAGNDDVVTLLGAFVDQVIGGPVLLVGHSYGAYLARGVAARRPDLALGLALVCPIGEQTHDVPDHEVVRQDAGARDELDPSQRAGFDEYFVVRTPATARRYREHVAPAQALVDEAALGRIFAGWAIDVGSEACRVPTLIVAGRRDSTAGYVDAVELLDRYPRATLAVVEGAGHALMHERPDLLAPLVADWLDRARTHHV
jgi:pimeloyl-ACP methyl ester carboxylesterase